MRTLASSSLLFVLCSALVSEAQETQPVDLYFARGSTISMLPADGTGVRLVRRGSGSPAGLAHHASSNRLFWVDSQLGTLSSVSVNGAGVRSHSLPQGSRPLDVAIDGDTVFWVDGQLGGLWTLALGAEGLPGAPRQLVAGSYPSANVVAARDGQAYFAARRSNRVARASLAGDTEPEFLWVEGALGDQLSFADDRLCWTEPQSLRCAAGRAASTEEVELATGRVFGALAATASEFFWTEGPGVYETPVQVRYRRHENEEARTLFESEQWILALESAGETLFWLDRSGIYSIGLRRLSEPPTLIQSFPDRPVQSLQVHQGQLFWIEGSGQRARIVKRPIVGGEEQALIEEAGAHSLAIAGNQLYWSVAARDVEALRSADLDGSNARTLQLGHVRSAGAVAATENAVYQVDRVFDRILRVDLSGGSKVWIKEQPEGNRRFFRRAFEEQPDRPQNLTTSVQHVYWTVWNNEKILRRALADGPVEAVLSERDVGGGITWDSASERLFWVESSPWSIWTVVPEGGAPTKVVERTRPELLAVSGEWLFWSEIDTSGPLVLASLYRCRIDDCAPEQIVDADEIGGSGHVFDRRRREVVVPAPSSLAIQGDRLYWTEHETQRLVSADFDGSEIQVLREGLGATAQLAAGRDALFLYDANQQTVLRLQASSEVEARPVFEEVARGKLTTESMAVAAGSLFFVEQRDDVIARLSLDFDAAPRSEAPIEVFWVDHHAEGEASDDLSPSLPASISSLAVSADRLLWTEHTSGRVMESDLQGEQVRELISGALLAGSLQVTDDALFWTQAQGIFTAPRRGGSPRLLVSGQGVSALAVDR